ncbi:pirin family protein [Aquirhabdus sp.]|uniref:pirin family protein n=1 Tax=Aquirhabdus sp. TaxID=2824160 RepID=UPI00396CEEA4
MKTLAFVHRNDTRSAVGDFSPVLSVFSHYELGNTISPFLLLDHLGPGYLKPSSRRQGVSDHPHRGFETVTIVFKGEIEHKDSKGGGGIIGAGDVQWMTAAHGIIHQELFSEAFTAQGGTFEMIQLWVNLPARDKLGPPRYQSLASADIPTVELPDGAGTVRVIAGQFNGVTGPAETHTRMNVLDVRMRAGTSALFNAQVGDTALVYLISGLLQYADAEPMEAAGLAVMSSHHTDFTVDTLEDSHFLVLTGEPMNEPIYGRGPFIMNTFEEILQAFEDSKNGLLG